MDFFRHSEELSTNSWKFMLQLACILQMVPGWKNTTSLRLLTSDKFENTSILKNRWEKRLRMLRIECELEIVSWNEDLFGSYEINLNNSNEKEKQSYFSNVNKFIRLHSENSSLLFLYLPPPSMTFSNEYLTHLTTITDNFPPTIMAHGITEVTSESL